MNVSKIFRKWKEKRKWTEKGTPLSRLFLLILLSICYSTPHSPFLIHFTKFQCFICYSKSLDISKFKAITSLLICFSTCWKNKERKCRKIKAKEPAVAIYIAGHSTQLDFSKHCKYSMFSEVLENILKENILKLKLVKGVAGRFGYYNE